MAGFSKPAVAHPDQGSVQDYCTRLGIPAQRQSAQTTFNWLAGFLGAGAGAAAATPVTAPAVPWLGAASAGAWGVGQIAGIGRASS